MTCESESIEGRQEDGGNSHQVTPPSPSPAAVLPRPDRHQPQRADRACWAKRSRHRARTAERPARVWQWTAWTGGPGGQAQWEEGADEHRDLRPRHRAHAPRYCPCPRRRTSGGSESSLTLRIAAISPRGDVHSPPRACRVGEALVNLLIGPDARQPPRARPPGREKPPGRSSSRRLERRGQR